ncbi:MAG: FAD-binding protein [Betaproteobacteria bacterium]|nr:FAD-binding protein [Betaproteobacteria bacterium]
MAGTGNAPDVVIAGGGIGGLVTALCLHRAGVNVRVFEAAREFRPLGVGINLQPHAVRVLHALGLEEDLRRTAIRTSELVYVNKFGQRIWQEPRGLDAGYAVPQYSIHRGELQMILHRAATRSLPPDAIRAGHELVGFGQDASGVHAVFVERGGGGDVTIAAGALVAADGIHSVVRRTFHPGEGEPRFSGRILWRATTRTAPVLSGRSMVWAGHDRQKFVAYPISESARVEGRALMNWIAELRVPEEQPPPRSDWNRRVDKAVFREAFASWDFGWLSVPGLIDGAEAVYEFPMVDRDPLPRWTHGRITLLGDAAHPMYPVGSNGASQAILDAEALADACSRQSRVEEVFAAYEAQRRPATSAVVLANRAGGPDRVLQLAEERAPNGFERIEDVIPRLELEAIANRYKQTAGFDRETVNRRVRGDVPP